MHGMHGHRPVYIYTSILDLFHTHYYLRRMLSNVQLAAESGDPVVRVRTLLGEVCLGLAPGIRAITPASN